jgi:cysteine dioxygenase
MEILKKEIINSEDLLNYINNVNKVRYKIFSEVSVYIIEDLKDFKNVGPIYKRKVIFRNDIFEIILIAWNPGSMSPIHGHPENGCLMFLINGSLNEERFNNNNEKSLGNRNINDNSVHYIHNREGKHRISNINNFTVYSVHIYSPPQF